ncbi:FtsW/RodA/SpoVE family cell cycle protein [Demequina aurantiaca]|uniref:FtsW/RodA/SpoVE family cell cycle protein n=1 Tax=Demequina aurantiaca TaxID=676200 RepID=UPI000785B649|nr:putative peptidoglycan glycosyltransferase FtsW [Demequina aurantiaca]
MTATASKRDAAASPTRSAATSYYLLVAATTILVVLGLAMVLSSSSILSIRQTDGNPYALFMVQAMAMAVGLVALIIGSRLSVKTWKRLAPWILFGSIALLMLVYVAGTSSGGNKNWLKVGPITMQPSEIGKLGIALYLGVVLATFRNELTNLKRALVPGGIGAGIVLALVLAGHDMGTAMVMAMMIAAAYWVAGLPARFFGLFAVLGGVGVLALINIGDTRLDRIQTFLKPEGCDIQAACQQTTHGTWALASGGLWGLGPGMSREKWGGLPAADNDFIFAVLGEEYGLIGTVLVLLAFAMIVIAVTRIVSRSRDPFVQIAGAAIGVWIVGQACVNIAVVVGLAPVTGVPLPIVSSGGSSLIMSMTALGVLMAFARHEPGAQEAFAARPSVIKRSLTVLSRGRRG